MLLLLVYPYVVIGITRYRRRETKGISMSERYFSSRKVFLLHLIQHIPDAIIYFEASVRSNILGLQGMKPKKCLSVGYDFPTHYEASFYRATIV